MCKGILYRQTENIAIGILLFSFFAMAYCQTPVPDIKINNLDGPVVISPSDTISVSIRLDPEGRTDNADWFLAGNTSLGLYFYDLRNWVDWVKPAAQIPLQSLPVIQLMDIPASALWSGDFTLYFGVDTLMDGAITWDQLFYDAVDFTIAGFSEDSRYIEAELGGKLTVMNKRGDVISIVIPPDSLYESAIVTMIARDTAAVSPFSTNIFPGVDIRPHDTLLKRPARLIVEFANTPHDQSLSALFFIKSSQVAFPLAYQYYEHNLLEGDIKHFSTYDGATPSNTESLLVLEALPSPEECENFPNKCKLIVDDIEGLLSGYSVFDHLSFEAGDRYMTLAKVFANKLCINYLINPIPLNACGFYADEFLRLRNILKLLGIEECSDTVNIFTPTDIQKRFNSLDQMCGFSDDFDGIWKINLKTESKICQWRETSPYDCSKIWNVSDETSYDAVYEQKMFVEISPTPYGHSIRVYPYLGAGHFFFPYNEPTPLTIEERNFSFTYRTNSTPFCEANDRYGDCWNIVKVSGRISDDGTKLVGKTGWFELDYGIVHTKKRCPVCSYSCYEDNQISYKMPWGCIQTGVFSGLKQ